MSRPQFFLIRCAVSAALLLLVIAVLRTLWYPGAYYEVSGVAKQVWILVAVVLVAGPVLSTFVWVPGKAGLKMDLIILSALELLVLIVAATTLYLRQPYFTVFAVDRFETHSRYGVLDFDLARDRFGARPTHEPRLVVARLPEDLEERDQILEETLLQGMPDIGQRPEFWSPYVSGVAEVIAAARPLSDLLDSGGERARAVGAWLHSDGRDPGGYKYLPLSGKEHDAAVIIDRSIGFPVATIVVDPWVSASQDGEPASDIEQDSSVMPTRRSGRPHEAGGAHAAGRRA